MIIEHTFSVGIKNAQLIDHFLIYTRGLINKFRFKNLTYIFPIDYPLKIIIKCIKISIFYTARQSIN